MKPCAIPSVISWSVFDLAAKQEKVNALEAQSQEATFWDDPRAAQSTMQQLSRLRGDIQHWTDIKKRIDDTLELASLEDESLRADLEAEATTLQTIVDKMSFEAMMNGQYDNEDVILSIQSGAGGTESQDWAAMLMRMYLRWAEDHGMQAEIMDQMDGEEAGIKSVSINVRGPYAYGYLQSERGVHRLVRISPFDANKRRHTSFARVEIVPDVQDDVNVELDDRDMDISYYKSSGAGGQHVQKNETAVRILHRPTGLVVTCQNERSQLQNRERALQVLKARLLDLERRKKEEEYSKLKGEHVDANFGSQIRSYVLHPYQMVKDLRTDYETGNTGAVLDGRIDEFMEAYLKWKPAESMA